MRGAFLAFAFIALALRVMIPAGFMAAPANDLPFAVVLCTGQGPMVLEPGQTLERHGDKPATGGENHDSPCVFAGHGVAAEAPDADLAPATVAVYAQLAPAAAVDLAPGRGLPAPPPPARGPPVLS